MTEVLIVGAGPAGLLLAAELRLAGIDTVVLERHPQRPGYCRGFNLNARALDLLARRGLAERLVSEGWQVPHAAFAGLPATLTLAGTRTDHPYTLGIAQTRVEEVLEAHALALGADLRRGHQLRTLTQDSASVTATVSTADGTEYRIRADYLVGCDGGRSTVRKQAGIDFPGTASTRFTLLGDVELADPDALPIGPTTGPGGSVFVVPRPGYVRILTTDPRPPADQDTPVTLDLLQRAVDDALGRPVHLRSPRWLSRFGNAARQAAAYVRGRIVLAGDAAHIHPPSGAIGVNVALDDVFNLGWKLAATVRGTAPAHLLDSYHAERHPAGAHVLASTQALALLADADADVRLGPVTDLLTRVARHPDGNRAFTETITGLDTRYPMHPDTDHPWLGRLTPDLPLTTADGPTRLTELLAPGRGVLLDLTDDGALREAAAGWTDRVDIVTATSPDHPELRAVLLRPDGHTAWVRTSDDGHLNDHLNDLHQALRHWHGAGAPA
ncbi:monooxygenase [Streptomyces rubellomurinus subsp. indigoferus]|nr:monooxygenase [Streptomyces rubellomurinus subsp. indigoferus]